MRQPWASPARGVDQQCQPGIGRQFHRLEVQLQVSDDGVTNLLESRPMKAHIVFRPPGAEYLTASGKFADELGQRLVMRIAPRFRAEHRGDVVCRALPIHEEVLRCRVQVHEPGVVRRPTWIGQHRRIQRARHTIGRQHVVPGITYHAGASVMASSIC